MKCEQIQAIMLRDLENGHPYICTNFSPPGWNECDIMAITKADRVKEFEIKVSRSDFFADFKKVDKHQAFKERSNGDFFKIPNQFYYVVPAGLITANEVPEYAGLIYIMDHMYRPNNLAPTVIKRAPTLHKDKATEKLIRTMCHTLTVRTLHGCSFLRHQFGKEVLV